MKKLLGFVAIILLAPAPMATDDYRIFVGYTYQIAHHKATYFTPFPWDDMTFDVTTDIKVIGSWNSFQAKVYINNMLYKSWGYSQVNLPVHQTRTFSLTPGKDVSIPHNYDGYRVSTELWYYMPGGGMGLASSDTYFWEHPK